MDNQGLIDKVNRLPQSPGCYLFKDREGKIIYVGKSKALKNRVRQYFQRVDKKEGKDRMLVQSIRDFDFIVTASETDALILECRLIKTYLPRYNVQLKRDKHFTYICISVRENRPGICITKEVQKDGSRYFGFFYSEEDAKRTVELINRIWKTPVCGKAVFKGNARSCLNRHIGKCMGPCEGDGDNERYRQVIEEVCKFLSGRSPGHIRRLEREMKQAVRELDYERAALLRDHLDSLGLLVKKSRRLNMPLESHDIFLFFRGFHEPRCSLFFIRNGAVLSRLDILELDNDDIRGLDGFLAGILAGRFDAGEGEFLTSCLLAIFADKYFVPAPGRWRQERMAAVLQKHFRDYTGR